MPMRSESSFWTCLQFCFWTLSRPYVRIWSAAILWATAVAATAASAGDDAWTNFRGPTDQGLTDAQHLPLRWSEEENVVWRTPLPGKAWSSPVIQGRRIWLTTATEDGTRLSVLCVDRETGKILIERLVHEVEEPQFCHPFNSYASPSPVIDGDRVYVSFGAPYNACLDFATGEVIWERTDFVCNHFRGAGSSPFILGDLLVLHFDGSDAQYVVGLDKHSGKTLWKTDRTMDYRDLDPSTGKPQAEGDFRKAFSTPLAVEVEGRPLLISIGSMAVYAYDPESGAELWRAEAPGSYSGSCRPVAGHGMVYAPMGYTGELWAIRPTGQGVVTDTHVAWRYGRGATRRSSPLLVGDLLFLVDINGVAACVNALTGEEHWRTRLGGNFSASPIYAAGKVYFFDEAGKTTVIEAAPEFRPLAVNQLDDGFMASPAVIGDTLYLRTRSALYRIEDASRRRP